MTEKQERQNQIDHPVINNFLSSFDNNNNNGGGGSIIFTNPCSKCGTTKRHSSSSSSSPSSSSSQIPNNLPSKIQQNSSNINSASFSDPNNPSQLQSTSASSPVSPSPTLPLLSPSSGSPLSPIWWRPSPSSSPPPPRKLDSFFDQQPRKLDSLSIPTKSWQEIVSSAFSTPSGTPDCVLSLSCGQCGSGSQRQDSPLQSISNAPVLPLPLSPSSVTPSLGSPSSVSPPSPIWWRPSPSPSPSPTHLSPSLVSPPPPPRKPNSFSTPTKSRQGFISSASSTPLSSPTIEGASANNSPSCALCIGSGGGSTRKGSPLLLSPSSGVASETANSNGGGSTPPSAAAKKRWMRVRNALKEMQHKWMMDNISQQLKEQNNEAPVMAANKKPNIDVNNQEVYVSSDKNVGEVQEVVRDENVSFDRDGDTMRVCYMCCCGRPKQIYFAITN